MDALTWWGHPTEGDGLMRRGLVAALSAAVAVGVTGGAGVASLDRGTVRVQTVGVTASTPEPTPTPVAATGESTATPVAAAPAPSVTATKTPTAKAHPLSTASSSPSPATTTRVVIVPGGTVTLRPGERIEDAGSATVPPRVGPSPSPPPPPDWKGPPQS